MTLSLGAIWSGFPVCALGPLLRPRLLMVGAWGLRPQTAACPGPRRHRPETCSTLFSLDADAFVAWPWAWMSLQSDCSGPFSIKGKAGSHHPPYLENAHGTHPSVDHSRVRPATWVPCKGPDMMSFSLAGRVQMCPGDSSMAMPGALSWPCECPQDTDTLTSLIA